MWQMEVFYIKNQNYEKRIELMKIVPLFFVFMLWTVSANACTCDWSRNFYDLCTESDVIVKFNVKDYDDYETVGGKSIPLTIVVEVLQVYKGMIPSVEMRFSGDDGLQCRKYAEHFKIGRDYYFQYNYPKEDEAPILDICGEYDLLIDNDVVQGDEYQENSTPKMSPDEFMEGLEENLGDLINPSFLPLSNLDDGTARTYSDVLLYSLFGILLLLFILLGRILIKTKH